MPSTSTERVNIHGCVLQTQSDRARKADRHAHPLENVLETNSEPAHDEA